MLIRRRDIATICVFLMRWVSEEFNILDACPVQCAEAAIRLWRALHPLVWEENDE